MKKTLLLTIAVLVVIVLIGLGFYLAYSGAKNSTSVNNSNNVNSVNSGNQNSNIPGLILNPDQENYFKLLVQIDLEGYNTYGYLDSRPLLDLKGNSTAIMADRIQQTLDAVQNDPQYKTYQITAIADPSSFKYQHTELETLIAQMDAQISENNNGSINSYPVHATLTLVKENDLWLLDQIELQKK